MLQKCGTVFVDNIITIIIFKRNFLILMKKFFNLSVIVCSVLLFNCTDNLTETRETELLTIDEWRYKQRK